MPNGLTGRAAPARDDLESIVGYAQEISEFSGSELERSYQNALEGNVDTRPVRLALVLSHPEAPFRNVEEARRLLDKYIESPRDGRCCRTFAKFLRGRLGPDPELARTREELSELRGHYGELEEQLEDLRGTMSKERERRVKLEAQIEALKAIEKKLNEPQRLE